MKFLSMFLRAHLPNEATRKSFMASSIFFNPTGGGTAVTSFRDTSFSTKATPPQHQSVAPPPKPLPPEKKSFSIATGELFLGIAARILKKSGTIVGGEDGGKPVVEMFTRDEEREWWWRRWRKEGIGAVVEDPVQPVVVWEQRNKDVEAERRRKAVTSPGFSFSAAGLLFPYHIGVAQLLIEKGYIKFNA